MVATKWSVMEMRLQAVIWHYMGIDMKKGRVMTWGLPASAKILLLGTLPLRWVTDPQAQQEVEEFAKAADRLSKRRNNFVHGVWGYHPDDPAKTIKLFSFRTAEQKILAHKQHYKAKDILDLAKEIDDLHRRIVAHLKKARAYIP
jgi:hypothetical protein